RTSATSATRLFWKLPGANSMMVEFIGPAGVGKTFLSNRTIEELRKRGDAVGDFNLIEINKLAPRNLALMARGVYLSASTRPKVPFHIMRAARIIVAYNI